MSSSMFRKKSRSRVRHHRARWNQQLTPPQLTTCGNPECRRTKPHQVACPACGHYNGRQVRPAGSRR